MDFQVCKYDVKIMSPLTSNNEYLFTFDVNGILDWS